MKKSIAFIGALFMGSIAFAQVSKKEDTNKTASRKVLDTDVKDLPTDPEVKTEDAKVNGYLQKTRKTGSNSSEVSDNTAATIKGTITQKGHKTTAPETEDFTIKGTNTSNKTIKVSGTQSEKTVADPYLKVTATKKE